MTTISSTPILDQRANTSDTAHSPQELKRQINELQGKLAFLRLPDIAPLQQNVQRLTTLTTLDPKHRADLFNADQRLQEAQRAHADAATIGAQIRTLQEQLTAAEYEQRMATIALANAQLEKAKANYFHCGEQLIAAYRELLTQQAANYRVPGARTDIPPGFNFEPALPVGWVGSVSDIMQKGFLPAEQPRPKVAA